MERYAVDRIDGVGCMVFLVSTIRSRCDELVNLWWCVDTREILAILFFFAVFIALRFFFRS